MKNLNRRQFIGTLGMGAAALAAAARAAEPAGERPNFLFILTDDQRWDALGVVQREQGERARFPWFKTPNLDRLAAEGVRFRNAFVVNSLCAPSRATFLTGQYGHRNRIVNNHTAFAAENITHASLLRAAGWKTAYCGKWHMGSQLERPGFDFAASFIGQGAYFDCPIVVNGVKTPSKGWVDDVTTDYLLGFIRENRERPFCATIGFKATHGPFTPPPRRAADFEGETARPVPNLDVPAVYRRGADAVPARRPGQRAAPGPNLGYFRTLAAMDDNVGRILAALDELKLAERTVVVFAGDNGYYLGEHGLGDKRSAYEESLRIPLLLRYPRLGAAGRTVDAMTLNIDLAPTLLDYAGVPVPPSMQGRSWRPLLEGAAPADWRKAWFYCYFLEAQFGVPMTTAVRTETAKLIKYPGHDDWTELFDLKADPYELRNLFSDPAAADLRRELEAEYERQKQAIGFAIPPFADRAAAADAKRTAPAGVVLEYRFDRDEPRKAVDASGRGHHGAVDGAELVEGRAGRKARRFDGAGCIDAANDDSLDPANAAWTVEVSLKAEKPDGIVVAHGGATNGYALLLEKGRPAFVYVANGETRRIAGEEPVGANWVALTAQVTGDNRILLQADGRTVAQGKIPRKIAKRPNDQFQVGADRKSPVTGQANAPGFTGLIDTVRITAGGTSRTGEPRPEGRDELPAEAGTPTRGGV